MRREKQPQAPAPTPIFDKGDKNTCGGKKMASLTNGGWECGYPCTEQ